MSVFANYTNDGQNSEQLMFSVAAQRRHPEYNQKLKHWIFCQETYDGGRQWFVNNVHKYIKEGDREFELRRERSFRFNHTREVVNLLTKYLYKEGAIRNMDNAPDCIKKYWCHSMLYGGDINTLMKAACSQSSITGDAWIITDTTADEAINTVSENGGKDRVYSYIVKPQDMLDFAYDSTGDLAWILFRVASRDDQDPFVSDPTIRENYIIWTKTNFYVMQEVIIKQEYGVTSSAAMSYGLGTPDSVYKPKFRLIKSGENKIGVIPAVRVPHIQDGNVYCKNGLIDDIVYLDRANANYCSNLDAIIQDQTFSQLVMPASGLDTGSAQEGDAERKILDMGTKRIFTYSSDATVGPNFISPDASQAKLIIEVMQTIVNEIYHSIGLAGERTSTDNGIGSQSSSGAAKAYDFDRLNAMLKSKADIMELVENQLVNMVLLWNGQKVIDNSENDDNTLVKYPDTYDVRGLPDEFDIAQNLMVVQAPDTVRRQQMTNLVEKLFPKLKQGLRDEMTKDIQSWPTTAVEQAQQMMRVTAENGNATGVIRDTMQPPVGGQPGGNPESQVVQPGETGDQTEKSPSNTPKSQQTPSKRLKGSKNPKQSKQGQAS